MLNIISRAMYVQAPLRTALRALIRKGRLGSYAFRMAIGALNRPHYAYIVYNAALLAKRLGHKSVSVLEFGVAGGAGLLSLEEHATEVERLLGVRIEIYGFDGGKGLPKPIDYRDLPYYWKEGSYAMDRAKLESRLTRAKLVLGDISETAAAFFRERSPAPIGAVIYDFDFYSSTAQALQMLRAGHEHYLPRLFCYFDDTVGGDMELYNDFTGERLAIHEFNAANERIKLSPPYHQLAVARREIWRSQIWIAHFFDHPSYDTFVGEATQELPL